MNADQNQAFSQLLTAWRRREDKRNPHTIQELAQARHALDGARAQMLSIGSRVAV